MTKKPAMELNLRTKALGLGFDEKNLYVTAIHNKFNQIRYRGHDVLENYATLTDEEIREFLEDFRTNHKIKGGDAYMVLPRDRVMVQTADFPLEARNNLDEVLAYQIGNYFPVDPEEYTFFPQVIGVSDQLKVMIVAVGKESLGACFGFIRRWNLKLAGLTLETFATVNALSKIAPDTMAESKLVVFRHYPQGLEMIAVNEGRLAGSHYMTFAVEDPEPGRTLLPHIEEAFSQTRIDPNDVDVYLSSGQDQHGLNAFLSEEVGIPLTTWDDQDGQTLEPEALPGLGAAVCAVHESLPLELNMLPENLRKRHKLLPIILVTILLVLGGIFMIVREVGVYQDLKQQHAKANADFEKIQQALQEVSLAKADYEAKIGEYQRYKPYIASGVLYRLLEGLANQLPLDTYITNLQIKDGAELTVQGESDDPFETQRILTNIPFLKNVEPGTAITVVRNSEGKKRFMFKADIDLEALQ